MPIGYPGNSITKAARAKSGGGFESAIEVVSGALANGQEVTLSNGNYGPSPTVVGASNFEQLTDGQTLEGAPTDAGYKTAMTIQGGFVSADTSLKHSGTKSAKVEWKSGATISAFGWTDMNPGTEHLRISYWRYQNLQYLAGTSVLDANIKQFYIFGTGSGALPQGLMYCQAGEDMWGVYNNVNQSVKNYNIGPTDSQGKWEHWDFYYYVGSGVDTNDAIVEFRKDGKLVIQRETYNFQEGAAAAGTWKDFRLGHMAQNVAISQCWYDELVVTSGGAQAIYVNDSPNWDDGLEHEMASQIPKIWSDSEVRFDLNASSLPTSTPLYCHVIKSDRTVVTHSIGAL